MTISIKHATTKIKRSIKTSCRSIAHLPQIMSTSSISNCMYNPLFQRHFAPSQTPIQQLLRPLLQVQFRYLLQRWQPHLRQLLALTLRTTRQCRLPAAQQRRVRNARASRLETSAHPRAQCAPYACLADSHWHILLDPVVGTIVKVRLYRSTVARNACNLPHGVVIEASGTASGKGKKRADGAGSDRFTDAIPSRVIGIGVSTVGSTRRNQAIEGVISQSLAVAAIPIVGYGNDIAVGVIPILQKARVRNLRLLFQFTAHHRPLREQHTAEGIQE